MAISRWSINYNNGKLMIVCDIRHNLSLVNSYTYKDLQISLYSSYHSGLPYTNPLGIFDFHDDEEEETIHYIDVSAVNNARLRPYFRMDLSINYRPNFKKMENLKADFSFSLLNLLNRKNVFARGYYLDFEEELETPKLAFSQKALLKTTPLILVRLHW